MKPTRLRLRRKPHSIDVNPAAPAIAKRRAEEARGKIETGLEALRKVRSAEELPTLQDLQSFTLDGFIRWVGIGNDTLYKTHPDLREKLNEELLRLRSLRTAAKKAKPRKRRWSEVASLKARIRELECLLEARNRDCTDLILALESARKTIRQLRGQRADQSTKASSSR